MEYSTFGDAEQYLSLGKTCAESLQNNSFFTALIDCSPGIRPVGMQLYSAIPYLVTQDPWLFNFLYLLLNLVSFYFIFTILGRTFCPQDKAGTRFLQFLICAVCLLPFIPILMSDMVALSFYCGGLSLLFQGTRYFNADTTTIKYQYAALFLSGLCFAASIMLKQNFFIYCGLTFIAFMIIYRNNIFVLGNASHRNFAAASWLILGFSLVLVQFLLVYIHTGVFWLYDIAETAEPFRIVHNQPYLELIAYSAPTKGGYLITLTESTSSLWFYLTRFYLGLSKIYLAIYQGYLPTDLTFSLDATKKLQLVLFFVSYCVFSFITFKANSQKVKVLILSAFLIAVSTAITTHTENRYYVFPRIILLLSALEYGKYWMERLCHQRKSA